MDNVKTVKTPSNDDLTDVKYSIETRPHDFLFSLHELNTLCFVSHLLFRLAGVLNVLDIPYVIMSFMTWLSCMSQMMSSTCVVCLTYRLG